ncbi:hypothetical protein HBH52_177960 [Parastagonospora nodorum]|nr:hypothetical protein HBH52_177960 [Parastagonospora nodorum]
MLFSNQAAQALIIASGLAFVSAAPAPVLVGVDEVILYGKGRLSVMKRSVLKELEDARNAAVAPPKPSYLEDNLTTYAGKQAAAPLSRLRKRDDSIIIPNPNSRFLGWDVQMSQVVKGAPTSISVSSGYSIGNSISVGAGVDLTLIKDFLSASMSTDYTHSWTSEQSQLFRADVPEGKYGAFVSNPWTNRASGNVWTGSIGGDGTLTPYQADSFDTKKFDAMEWVDGVISLCVGDTFPLKRCVGEGNL